MNTPSNGGWKPIDNHGGTPNWLIETETALAEFFSLSGEADKYIAIVNWITPAGALLTAFDEKRLGEIIEDLQDTLHRLQYRKVNPPDLPPRGN